MVLSRREQREIDREIKKGEFLGTAKESRRVLTKNLVQALPFEERRVRQTFKPKKPKIAFNPQQLNIRPIQQEITLEQNMLRQMLGGGERTWGTGQNLPKLNRSITSGSGIIKSEDYDRETARCFGFR